MKQHPCYLEEKEKRENPENPEKIVQKDKGGEKEKHENLVNNMIHHNINKIC